MDKSWESNYQWILPLINNKIESIVEVGSKDCLDAIALSEYFDAPVTSFDPDPRAVEICKKNIAIRGTNRVRLFEIALSSDSFEKELKLYEMGSSSLHTNDELELHSTSIVIAKRFDSLGIDAPDLLVMDAQGHEGQILIGFGRLLKECSYIAFETSTKSQYDTNLNFFQIHCFLRRNGFKFVASSVSGVGFVRFILLLIRQIIWSLRNSTFRKMFLFQNFCDVLYVARDLSPTRLDKCLSNLKSKKFGI